MKFPLGSIGILFNTWGPVVQNI